MAAGERGSLRKWAPQLLTVVLIWVGWQVVVGLLVARGPVELAVKLAPNSAMALSRAAEAELAAGRTDNARDLAAMALARAPFDVRTMRTLGLAVAETDPDAADPILTLAGNWSLRDDPSHAWLVERRLRQGDYVGSFGHADALARRVESKREPIFKYFVLAAVNDPRAMNALLQRFAAHPNWRLAFLLFLRSAEDGPPVQAALALALDDGRGALTDFELEIIYRDWLQDRRLAGLIELKQRTGRPPASLINDGTFNGGAAPWPFRWEMFSHAGITSVVTADGDRVGEQALLLESDGFNANIVARQTLTLPPGAFTIGYLTRTELGTDTRLRWTLTCVETGKRLIDPQVPRSDRWVRTRIQVVVPAEDCTVQRLALESVRGPRRTSIITWIDDVQIARGRR